MAILRHMTNDDLMAYKRLCSICYVYKDTEPAEVLQEDELWQRVGVFGEDGSLLSAMIQIDYTARFEGQDVKLLGVGGVVSDPVARGQRGVRQMFEEGLPRLYEAGYVFSALYPFSHRFYRKFGYELGEMRRLAVFAPSNLRGNLFQADEIVRVLPDGDDHGMRQVYERYIEKHNFALHRTENMWTDVRRGTPWETLKHMYVLKRKGEPIAYWVGQAERGNEKTLHIRHLGYTCPQGCEAIFSMLRGFDEYGKISMMVPPEIEIRFMVDDPHHIDSEETRNGAMYRIMNVEKALSMLPAPIQPGHCVVEVTDQQISQNNGLFLVEGDASQIKVSKVKDTAVDLRCTINGLTALVTGVQELEDGILSGHGELLSEENLSFMSALFHRRKIHLNWAF